MRLRNDNRALERLELSNLLIKQSNKKIKLTKKTILEIGMGKGEMITEMANLYPNLTFYGLEKYATAAAKAIKKAKEYSLENFKIILDDAIKIDEIFSGKCDVIYLTFSDPWPKKRHEKRRLTYKTFLEKYAKILTKDGVIKLKTDNDSLYNYSLESFKENNWKIIDFGTDLHGSKYNSKNIKTGYEVKWSGKGKNINFIIAKKP